MGIGFRGNLSSIPSHGLSWILLARSHYVYSSNVKSQESFLSFLSNSVIRQWDSSRSVSFEVQRGTASLWNDLKAKIDFPCLKTIFCLCNVNKSGNGLVNKSKGGWRDAADWLKLISVSAYFILHTISSRLCWCREIKKRIVGRSKCCIILNRKKANLFHLVKSSMTFAGYGMNELWPLLDSVWFGAGLVETWESLLLERSTNGLNPINLSTTK